MHHHCLQLNVRPGTSIYRDPPCSHQLLVYTRYVLPLFLEYFVIPYESDMVHGTLEFEFKAFKLLQSLIALILKFAVFERKAWLRYLPMVGVLLERCQYGDMGGCRIVVAIRCHDSAFSLGLWTLNAP